MTEGAGCRGQQAELEPTSLSCLLTSTNILWMCVPECAYTCEHIQRNIIFKKSRRLEKELPRGPVFRRIGPATDGPNGSLKKIPRRAFSSRDTHCGFPWHCVVCMLRPGHTIRRWYPKTDRKKKTEAETLPHRREAKGCSMILNRQGQC